MLKYQAMNPEIISSETLDDNMNVQLHENPKFINVIFSYKF
jgi:hypothetical protein